MIFRKKTQLKFQGVSLYANRIKNLTLLTNLVKLHVLKPPPKTSDVQKAAEDAVAQVKALGGSGGIISIDKHGHTGFAWTKDKLGMYHGEARLGDKPIVYWPLGEK